MRPSALRGDGRLGGRAGIEPGALHAEDGAVVAGDGGDQRREAAHRRAFAVAKLRVIAQRRETAAREAPGVEITLGMGGVDGAAAPPQAAGSLCRVPGCVRGSRIPGTGPGTVRGRLQGEEGARLVERRAQRRRARAVADQIEQVAVRAPGRIGPLPRRAGSWRDIPNAGSGKRLAKPCTGQAAPLSGQRMARSSSAVSRTVRRSTPSSASRSQPSGRSRDVSG